MKTKQVKSPREMTAREHLLAALAHLKAVGDRDGWAFADLPMLVLLVEQTLDRVGDEESGE